MKQLTRKPATPVGRLVHWNRNLAAVGLMCLAAHVTLDVVLRFFFQKVLTGTFEVTTYIWMPMVVFLPMAYAAVRSEHIKMPLLVDKLGGRTKDSAELLVNSIILVCVTALTIAQASSVKLAYVSQQATNGSIQLPLWIGKSIALLGLASMAIAVMSQVLQSGRSVLHNRTMDRKGTRSGVSAAYFIVAASTCAILTVIILAPLGRESLSLLSLAALVLLMILGVPIGIALITSSALGIQKILGTDALLTSVPELLFGAGANWQLTVIPLFVVVGSLLWASGVAAKAFTAIVSFFGRVPGGLAFSANISGAGLATVSGSSIGITYALGRIAIPEMLKRNYSPSIATASVAMAGTLGQIIPPSIQLVVYAGVVQVSVGKQLFAGVVPGVLLATAFALLIIGLAILKPNLMPRETQRLTYREKIATLPGVIPILVIVVTIVGGIASGLFTVTEAAAVGAAASAVVALIMSLAATNTRPVRLEQSAVPQSFISTSRKALNTSVTSVGSIFLLLVGVYIFTRFLTVTRITNKMADLVVSLGLPYLGFIAILILVYLVLGAFLDPLAMILITVPILSNSFDFYGIDPIWFGVFVIIMAEIAMVTPPVGILSFIVHRISQEPAVNHGVEVRLTQVFAGVTGFVIIALLIVGLLALFPELVLWLPNRLV